jgi:hypothetical protein
VLYIAIAAVWFLLAFVGLALCRLAALSDDSHKLEMVDWVAAHDLRPATVDRGAAARPLRQTGRRRATG